MKKIFLALLLLLSVLYPLTAQYTTFNAHSHNDYANTTPFWLAYNNPFGSIEADIWVVGRDLLVAHHESEIKSGRTLDSLYIQPIVRVFRQNAGKPWTDCSSTFQLLIDLKTAAEPTLSLLIEKLKIYPDVFDPAVNPNAVRIVITGNRPEPSEFVNYPGFIYFDGILGKKYTDQQLKRILLFSEDLKKFTSWDGKGNINYEEKIRLQNIIDSIHALNNKIRFWNAPDNINAWNTYIKMGIDYINTDHIIELSEFLNNLDH
jgi:alkaline phosphatase